MKTEAGGASPSAAILVKRATALDVTVATLFQPRAPGGESGGAPAQGEVEARLLLRVGGDARGFRDLQRGRFVGQEIDSWGSESGVSEPWGRRSIRGA